MLIVCISGSRNSLAVRIDVAYRIFQCNWLDMFQSMSWYSRERNIFTYGESNPYGTGPGHLQFSTPFRYSVNILINKKRNIRKDTTFCGGINQDEVKSKNIIKIFVD